MTAFYNEIDPYAAEWLRNLIAAGHIAPGVVDTRSIEDIEPRELHRYTQCHFFAGVGVWSLALRMAGWPDSRPIWTGSCPCQPFSAAGKGAGFSDERHLWPAWHHIVSQCRPAVVFGEQVASSDAMPWLDLVQDDLEAVGYAFGAVPFPSAGVGAPHIRDRLYWVADSIAIGSSSRSRDTSTSDRALEFERSRAAGFVVDADGGHSSSEREQRRGEQRQQPADSGVGELADTRRGDAEREVDAAGHAGPQGDGSTDQSGGRGRAPGLLADDDDTGLSRFAGLRLQRPHLHDADGRRVVGGFWADADWIPCRDNKWRPVEPGSFPLAHGVANRVGRLRAYGNAINAEAARAFVEAYLDGQQ